MDQEESVGINMSKHIRYRILNLLLDKFGFCLADRQVMAFSLIMVVAALSR